MGRLAREFTKHARELEGTHPDRRGQRGERVRLPVSRLKHLAGRLDALRVPLELPRAVQLAFNAAAPADAGNQLAREALQRERVGVCGQLHESQPEERETVRG